MYIDTVLCALVAFASTYILIPAIINVARVKKLYDVPNARSSHSEITPSLGGIGIFAGMMLSIVLFVSIESIPEIQYILAAFLVIFLIGVRDDILPLAPRKKLLGQILAAGLMVFKADIRLTSLYGVFGIHDIPFEASAILSIFTFIVIINSVNLIDGINGLAGSISALISGMLGVWFVAVGEYGYAVISFSLLGATIAFLRYNFTPAKIFMGDTGSLLLGLTIAALSIKFIEFNKVMELGPYKLDSVPAIAVSLLILPLFDTLRVFIKRVFGGKSPFAPDRTHIHHILLDIGMTHMQATGTLVAGTLAFFAITFSLQKIGTSYLILLILFLAVIVTGLVTNYAKRLKAEIK